LPGNSVVGPRASVFSPGKYGEAGDVCFIVDTAGCRQADNSGCLDPPVNEKVQENKPLEARSSFPEEPKGLAFDWRHLGRKLCLLKC